jgi:hypothetical protein
VVVPSLGNSCIFRSSAVQKAILKKTTGCPGRLLYHDSCYLVEERGRSATIFNGQIMPCMKQAVVRRLKCMRLSCVIRRVLTDQKDIRVLGPDFSSSSAQFDTNPDSTLSRATCFFQKCVLYHNSKQFIALPRRTRSV